MKRSEINALIRDAIAFCEANRFQLPPFAFWSPDDWKRKGHEADEIRDCMLGWDLTDFGYVKSYCEKLLLIGEDQVTPMHFHWAKSEDIINRGGGNLLVQVYNATDDEKLADTDVPVSTDGVARTVKAGEIVRLEPGESITLVRRVYHKFWGETGKGMVLGGEVSAVNDDTKDNRFLEPLGRFPAIEEDEPPLHLLYNDYATYYQAK